MLTYSGQNWDKYIPHDRFSDSLNWEIGNSLVEYLAEFQEFKDGSVLLRLSGWTSNIQIYTKTYINFYTWINWNISLIEDLILNSYIETILQIFNHRFIRNIQSTVLKQIGWRFFAYWKLADDALRYPLNGRTQRLWVKEASFVIHFVTNFDLRLFWCWWRSFGSTVKYTVLMTENIRS